MISTITRAYFSDLKLNRSSTEKDRQVCIANISPLERQKRLRFGVGQFIFSLLILGVLLLLHLNPLWRLPLLFMFWAAAVGYFQAYDKT
jgi:hypothetical protein